MPDLIRLTLDSVAARSAIAPILAYLAGIVTCIGPCIAPRFLAVSALAAAARTRRERLLTLSALGFGLCLMYVLLGIAVELLHRVTNDSTWIYAICGGAFAVMGVRMLVKGEHSHTTPRILASSKSTSIGASFLLGCSFGVVVSPCCTPVIAAIAVFTAGSRFPWFAAVTLFAFGLGHVMPLFLAGIGMERLRLTLERAEGAIETVGAAMLIALAGYYAVLA